MKILHIDSSVLSANSVSRQLTQAVVDGIKAAHPEAEVIYRDLDQQSPAHLSSTILGANFIDAAQRSDEQKRELALTDAMIEELLGADTLVLGVPMYNFAPPSQLKAWIDRVLVAGRTFQYTDNGPVGLATGKKAVIVSSRGGIYSEGPAQAMDHQESYLKAVLGFIGITDVTVIRAEGVNMRDVREQAIAAAQQQVRALVEAA